MTQTYNENVVIDNSTDETQLTIHGSGNAGSEQSSPLQSWQTNDSVEQARITGDGRLQIGSFSGGTMSTDDSLIEAHRSETDTSKPKRGFHLLGAITDPLSSIISWIVHELVLKGTSGISALHTALRVRLTNENNGDMTGAELFGGDIEVQNDGGNSGTNGKVPSAVGLRIGMVNQSNGYLETGRGVEIDTANSGSADTLVGLEINDVDEGTDNYAIRTGAGKVKLGSVTTGLLKSVNGEVKNIATTADSDVEMTGATDTVDGATGTVPQPVAGDEGKFLRGDGQWATPSGSGGGSGPLIVAYDKKTSGTAAGSSVAGTQTRALNTLHNPNSVSGVSLASNQIDLPAGTYRVIDISAPCKAADNHQVYVYDVDAADVLADDNGEDMYGTSEESGDGDGTMTRSHVMPTVFTLTATTTLEVRHYTEKAVTSIGLGNGAGYAHEIYTIFAVEKL